MTTSRLRTPVRGHPFAARPVAGAVLRAGQGARLVREPDNPRDPYAVAVWVDRSGSAWRVGYLDRAVAAWLAPRLDTGEGWSARMAGWVPAPGGGWRRPLVELAPAEVAAPSTAGWRELALPRDGLFGRPPGVRRRVVRPA